MPLVNVLGEVIADTDAVTAHLAPGAKLDEVLEQLPALARVEIEFPKFRDGRGFTLARALRERHGYKGDIRAIGHFIPDQFAALVACGFTSFVTPDSHEPAQFAAAIGTRQPGQLLRRMVTRAREG